MIPSAFLPIGRSFPKECLHPFHGIFRGTEGGEQIISGIRPLVVRKTISSPSARKAASFPSAFSFAQGSEEPALAILSRHGYPPS
jgi:hypothetical protein